MKDNYVVSLFLSFAITFFLNCIPILIYRYKIKKYAINRRKARIICILYCLSIIIVFGVICFLLNTPIKIIPEIVWALINYRILTKPGANDYMYYGDSTDMLDT